MQYTDNADVFSAGGRKVGNIERVVINPVTREITHLVVKKGFLLTRDKVIPVDQVDSATEDRVVLKTRFDLEDKWPDFEQYHYVRAENTGVYPEWRKGYAWPVVWYHPLAYLSPRDYPGYKRPKYITKTDRNIPEGTIPLEEGAKVLDVKGENLGAIERLCTGSEDHLVTHLLISQGLLSKEKKMIPSDWVKNVKEDTIRLSVEKALIERLPEFPARE